jgi:hypothetical protein
MLRVFSLCLFQWEFSVLCYQQVAQAGWSPVLFRVMQGITAFPVGSGIFFIF